MEKELPADATVFATAGIDGRRPKTVFTVEQAALVIYVNPELEELRQLVAGARARLAELEVDYAREKSRVDAMQAALFRRLRESYQKRDRLRLILDYRKKYLDSLVRGGENEAKQAEENFAQARAQSDRDYEETAAAVAEKQAFSAEYDLGAFFAFRKASRSAFSAGLIILTLAPAFSREST